MSKFTTISIPIQLNEKLKAMIADTGFHSVSSFATYVLRQIISETTHSATGFNAEDEQKVKDRLKSLGYLK